MKELEYAIMCFLNEYHRRLIFYHEKYQLLQGVKYRKQMEEQHQELIREKYRANCFEAAYELKSYYAENKILSNTIVLKLRPESPELQEIVSIKIPGESYGEIYEYSHHAIEIFKEHGRYKVHDVLHRKERVWLEDYLDMVCKVNNCGRDRLCYDMGYLAPCHAFASNMQELSDLMKYLDRTYNIGNPRLNLMNLQGEEGMLLSDTMVMDFDAFGKPFGVTGLEVIKHWQVVYNHMMTVRFNTLHMLCLAHIMKDPILKFGMAEALFDDEKMRQLVERLVSGK